MSELKKSPSDIYEVKESPWLKQNEQPASRKRRRSSKSFTEATAQDLSTSHRRRSRNSGFRRFLHLMKKPEFSKKFWLITLSIFFTALLLLIVWDLWFRYPNPEPDYTDDVYRAVVE